MQCVFRHFVSLSSHLSALSREDGKIVDARYVALNAIQLDSD